MPNPFMTAPFRQFGAANVISASTTSASGALPRAKDQTAIVSNPTTAVCFAKFGSTAVTATNTDAAIMPGDSRIFTLLEAETTVAVLLSAATGTIYVSCGDGV